MDPNIFKYVWRHTRKQQIWVLIIVLLAMPPYFLAFDLPKKIVNGPITGQGFEDETSAYRFLDINIALPDWLGGASFQLFDGFELDRFGALMALSLSFLALVCINGLFKFYINTYKGRLGERMLRRMRYELLDRVMRFPLSQFRRVKPSEVATMVKDEVEPLGGFIGDAFVQPVFLLMQAMTAMLFIMLQNFWLGMIAGGIVAAQALLIPRLRRRLIELGRQRQLETRALAGRIGEMVDSIGSVHAHDTSNYERAEMSARLGKIFAIRYELFQRKFFVKFLNNFLAQMTPFLFYSVGGYFALTGRLDIGQLVAVIAAYKDLPSPIKELIDWDQQRIDVQVKYNQVLEQFTVENMIDEDLQKVAVEPVPGIEGAFRLSNVATIDDSGSKLLENLSVNLKIDEKIAVVGGANSGAEYLADTLARLLPPTSGRVMLGSEDLDDYPESVTGRRLSYAPSDLTLYQGSVYYNLVYTLKHAPLQDHSYEGSDKALRDWQIAEARMTGNTELDINADWIDYAAAGAKGPDDLLEQLKRVLNMVELDEDILHLGLRGLIDPVTRPELAARILEARKGLHERLEEQGDTNLVEFFDPEVYSSQATIGENLMFGTPVSNDLAEAKLTSNPYVRDLLKSTGLDETLYSIGREIATTAIELFADLPPDHPFFQQLSFMSADDIPEYQAILSRVQNQPVNEVNDDDFQKIIGLSCLYIEPRHRMGLLDEEVKQRIVAARHAFREQLPEEMAGAVEFYDPETYNRAASIQDNVLSGRIAYGVAGGPEKILKLILSVLEDHDLHDAVFEVGLDFNVGSAGKRLTQSQRQKLSVARALLKHGDLLIANRALSSLDRTTQARIIDRVLEEAGSEEHGTFGVVWAVANPSLARQFPRVIVMDAGKLAEDGSPEALLKENGMFAKLTGAS